MQAAFQSGFASALLDVLFSKVTEFVIVEAKKFRDCEVTLTNLKITILEAHKILKELDATKMEENIKRVVEERVDDLTGLFYDVEDLIGDIVALMNRYSGSSHNSVSRVFMKKGKLTMPREIVKLKKKLDAIVAQLQKLKELCEKPESEKVESSYQNQRNSTIPFIGRECEVVEILANLLSDTSKFDGVSILGMSGLGKTRLAETIQSKATDYFSASLWIDVPGGCFHYKRVDELGVIQPCGNNQGDSSILIIFDNLLNVELDVWCDMVTEMRKTGINGKVYTKIRFLITTFNPVVVKHTRTQSHYLKLLCDEECEKVIKETTVSMGRDKSEWPSQSDVIHSLAKNCGGLPSVAHRLGQYLVQFGEDHVRNDLRGDLWGSNDVKRKIFPALNSCYLKFNSHLKRYLFYFSLFPHDCNYTFTKDELVHLWVGEGFIQHPEGVAKMIHIGKEHFDEFLGMSTIQLLDKTTSSGMETYELNQMSHKFAKLAATKTCLRLTKDMHVSDTKVRHVSLCYTNNCPPYWDELRKLKVLRTFFALFNKNIGEIPHYAVKKLIRLRVLSLSDSDVSKLPDSIDHLKRLCYLNISRTHIKTLPGTLCKLTSLQFLKLSQGHGTRLDWFLDEFEKLTNMIDVDWEESDIKAWGLPPNIGKLSSLQTLPLFPVQNKNGYRITELKDMNHLQGSILITTLQNVRNGDEAALEKKSFKKVELEWGSISNSKDEAKHVLTSLKPKDCLKQLKITNYDGDEFPDWMTHSLIELEEMHLENCPSVQGLPKNGFLPKLKSLTLEGLQNVVSIDHYFFGQGNFPNLESLEIMFMEQLQEWNVGPDSKLMPRLKALQFSSCQNLVNVSSLEHHSSLNKLKILRCGEMSSLPLLPSSLEELIIEESGKLKDRCTEGGEDWTKFDHVPDVQVGFRKIRSRGITASNYPNQIVSHTS